MCGIAGVLYADAARPVDVAVLGGLAARLVHRGPDATGLWHEAGVGLAHRRLSVIDVNGGDQPVTNEDGSIVVVFNGEIYNHDALRGLLTARGHRFRTRADTEVLVHLYEEHGPWLVNRLRGMFTFALWDRRERRLLLARDRVGLKPLYLYRDADKVVFGSEIKAILAHPGVACDIDPVSLDQYLALGIIAGSRAIFRRFEKLPAAHLVVLTAPDLTARPQRYWQLSADPDMRRSPDEWGEAIRAKVDESVRLHLASDVPLGAFLSGGVDSSVIVSSAAALTPALQTFAVGFDDERCNELGFARQVAEHCGTRHTQAIASSEAAGVVSDLAYHSDEPFGDASAVAALMVARLARRAVKVVLSGDGGDEAFGGYPRYAGDAREAALRRLLPSRFRRAAIAPISRLWPQAEWMPRPLRGKVLLTNLSLPPAEAYANTLMLCRQPLRQRLLAPDVRAAVHGFDPARAIIDSYEAAEHHGPVAAMMASDIAVRLPDDYLVKIDRTSMACGLEVRPPFLDHELLELAARIPPGLKVRRGTTKWILKRTYRERLPRGIVDRPKQGFEIPVHVWFRGPLREMFESTVLEPGSPVAHLLDRRQVRRLYDAHLAGTARAGHVLWMLLMLTEWGAHYLAHRRAA